MSSEDSLDLLSDKETLVEHVESDSESVSPSHASIGKKKTFDFSMMDPADVGNNLSAALQAEQEFLDFMFSLPQIQKEANDMAAAVKVPTPVVPKKAVPVVQKKPLSPQTLRKKSPSRGSLQMAGVPSRAGLDHLDNLCRMMEQLGDLKEQNTRLQRRVQYLEDLKTLQEMHKDMESSIEARKQALSLGSFSLSDSDLRLEELSNILYRVDSEDSLDTSLSPSKSKDQLLDIPDPTRQYQRHSSSEDDHRLCIEKDPRPNDKEKKIHKSAWGKVKHMISKRENVRKKSSDGEITRKGTNSTSMRIKSTRQDGSSAINQEVATGTSDPEFQEYDLDYESNDPDGGSWEWDVDAEGGIWMGPKTESGDIEPMDPTVPVIERKPKPSLTITVPSNENLHKSPKSKSPNVTQEILKMNNSPKKSPLLRRSLMSHIHQSSQPPSPSKKNLNNSFSFDNGAEHESDSTPGLSPELSPDDIISRPGRRASKISRDAARHVSLPASVVHKNLVELQRTLTGEFNKKLQEWEKLKGPQGLMGALVEIQGSFNPEEGLPQDFKKKLQEWEKIKGKDKVKPGEFIRPQVPTNQSSHHVTPSNDDSKMKKHDEDDLPPDFKKKLTEWEIRKALVGKGQQNVEKLQKNLGEEFNKKMEEWEKMKAVGQGKMTALGINESSLPRVELQTSVSVSSLTGLGSEPANNEVMALKLREIGPKITGGSGGGVGAATTGLDRKGSASKVKKLKTPKQEKVPIAKGETGQKTRDKELVWLEKELSKIDKEKQRLEREKEKYAERESRLEKMRQAMRQGPAENKEIYIKTSTGEFRFEGISQTFTKKLYEWEERRGIRPESSTFVLLDPNYRAPEKNEMADRARSPENKRMLRSRSESSLADMSPNAISSIITHQSSLSLNEKDNIIEDSSMLQVENKSASEPTLSAEDVGGESSSKGRKCSRMNSVDVPSEEDPLTFYEQTNICRKERKRSRSSSLPPYAPAEITKLIDSSGSEDNLARRKQEDVDDELTELNSATLIVQPGALMSEGNHFDLINVQRSEESYRYLLHENMTLLGKLKEQETLCRALETQMGDIDTKMGTVADQHHKTLEKLQRQVTIMKKSESSNRMSDQVDQNNVQDESDEAEKNQRLIEQLKARIEELENKGDKLMEEKEALECAFKLHKEHETQIAESLLLRIRELQDAGAEVNIQTVTPAIQPEISFPREENQETSDEPKQVKCIPELASPILQLKRRRRKRRDEQRKSEESDDTNEDEIEVNGKRKCEKEVKEKKKKKTPPKKVQKLHSLTADLLFQAKRLEGALVTKHHLNQENQEELPKPNPQKIYRNRSLKGRSSLRLSKEDNRPFPDQGKKTKGPQSTGRTWSSIEAIASLDEEHVLGKKKKKESSANESQELLAMNAELSRMAKELRREMMNLWSFRESTSPESNSSDNREDLISANRTNRRKRKDSGKSSNEAWLNDEANEVFKNIASLQETQSAPDFNLYSCPQDSSNDEREKRPSKYRLSSPEIKDKNFNPWNVGPLSIFEAVVEQKPVEQADDELIIKEEKDVETSKVNWSVGPNEEISVEDIKESSLTKLPLENSNSTISPTEWIVPILLEDANDIHQVEPQETSEHHDHFDFETPFPVESRTTIGDLLRAEEEQKINDQQIVYRPHSRISTSDEDEKRIQSDQYSTLRTEILSSSFEYDESDIYDPELDKEKMIVDNLFWQENAHMTYPPSKSSEMSQLQLEKVGLMIAEATKKIANKEESEEAAWNNLTSKLKSIESPQQETEKSDITEFETEVACKRKENEREGGLRTRRVSDTQVAYKQETTVETPSPPINKDELYKQKYFYFKKVGRIPSIRRNQSESDVLGLHPVSRPSDVTTNGSDVFVQTHLTLFTVTGDQKNSSKSIVTPTFLVESDKQSDLPPNENSNLVRDLHVNGTSLRDSENGNDDHSLSPSTGRKELSLSGPKPFVRSKSTGERGQATFLDNFTSSFQYKSSPVESKKKVLNSACGSSPAVRNMIEQYNKRITEKQEMLINPFKPGDPFCTKKLSTISDTTDMSSKSRDCHKPCGGARSKVRDHTMISKSQSASVLPRSEHNKFVIQRSLSGMNSTAMKDYMDYETDATSSGTLIGSSIYLVGKKASTDTSLDLDTSVEDYCSTKATLSQLQHDPENRATKIQKAKEQFFSGGAAQPANESSDEPNTSFSSDSNVIPVPSTSEGPVKPPRTFTQITNIPHNPSFRRQSEGSQIPEHHKSVLKSASSGVIEMRPQIQSRPPTNRHRKSSESPSRDTRKTSKGLFKMFKRSRAKDSKDLSAVQKLCQQTLEMDVTHSSSDNTAPSSCNQSPSLLRVPIATNAAAYLDADSLEPGSSKTLPRQDSNHENPSSSSSRSCPSSPVGLRKSKTAKFLAKGKKIFKSRSPSPNPKSS